MEIELDSMGDTGPYEPGHDIIFEDDTQTIHHEIWGTDGYIHIHREQIDNPKEYFIRKLAGA